MALGSRGLHNQATTPCIRICVQYQVNIGDDDADDDDDDGDDNDANNENLALGTTSAPC